MSATDFDRLFKLDEAAGAFFRCILALKLTSFTAHNPYEIVHLTNRFTGLNK